MRDLGKRLRLDGWHYDRCGLGISSLLLGPMDVESEEM